MRFKARFMALAVIVSSSVPALAETPSKVTWKFSTKSVAIGVYEVHMTATIAPGWHTYSENPGARVPTPTACQFMQDPTVTPTGKVTEVGKLRTFDEPRWGGPTRGYEGVVDFVQRVTITAPGKTTVAGFVESMACHAGDCTPAEQASFSLTVGG